MFPTPYCTVSRLHIANEFQCARLDLILLSGPGPRQSVELNDDNDDAEFQRLGHEELSFNLAKENMNFRSTPEGFHHENIIVSRHCVAFYMTTHVHF